MSEPTPVDAYRAAVQITGARLLGVVAAALGETHPQLYIRMGVVVSELFNDAQVQVEALGTDA